jgi:HD superfamily phosphohydrolase
MLFDPASELAAVFDRAAAPWIGDIPNEVLQRLIYVILNWKERIDPPEGFEKILEREIEQAREQPAGEATEKALKRLEQLGVWHAEFLRDRLFHPFMSDIIGNTICSDLLDYLPRDRTYLGMEARHHSRLQRYFTIREGSLYPPEEGFRMSIMVTRGAHGGQRRDVATAVLDIMRERYEMAERVYYHHKKASASAMLAKLVELTPPALRPRDDDRIYPAPWDSAETFPARPPHMTHLSDAGLIQYLGDVNVGKDNRSLQRHLYTALAYRRRDMYRTLLVVDVDLANAGTRRFKYIANDLRGPDSEPNSSTRLAMERKLAAAAGAEEGAVIIYCPSPSMQSKEVDARLEISENRVLPLRVQEEAFTYHAEVELLKHYYASLWRAYIFVAPRIFADEIRCKAIVDAFCDHYKLPTASAYQKVRGHRFAAADAEPGESLPPEARKTAAPAPEVDQLVAAGLVDEADLRTAMRPRAILRMVLPVLGKQSLDRREDKLFSEFIQDEIYPMQSQEFVAWLDHAKRELGPPAGSERFHAGDITIIITRLREAIKNFRQKALIENNDAQGNPTTSAS